MFRDIATLVAFISDNARWLAAGFLLALGSSFGQTYFIAIFAEPIRAEFGLSHGQWGIIYMVGTLASAACLIQLGRRVDDMAPRRLAMMVIAAFTLVCLGMTATPNWWILLFLVFGLRLCGQGMLSHLSQTLTARWFSATRGRALAVAGFGYPLGEALTPLLAVGLIAAIGWRATWGVAAICLLAVLAPALWFLLKRPRQPRGAAEAASLNSAGLGGRHWTRGEAVRSTPFWLIAAGIISPSCIITVVFFLPAHIAETKDWPLVDWAATYSIYALVSVGASLLAGWAIDRFSARSLLAVYQLPMAAALTVLAFGRDVSTMPLFMSLLGLTGGAASAIHASLMAELFGSRHLGAIKALAHALMVFASAAGPGAVGLLLDGGVAFETQCLWMAGYVGLISLLYAATAARLRDPAPETQKLT
ncbi:MAG: MFS transporter [Rhodobacteraceae bacterium]|nr:MFS transporter [Paracoccaceae bacterium]